MKTQRVQLDISSDIFDKVMFFLENLPKNKVKLNLLNSSKDSLDDEGTNIFSKTAGLLSSHTIDPLAWQKEMRREWDR
ncbi:MAG: hypothetical protein HF962_08660 [Sulfurovum sp.]|nr:hypothetical protein [Sulfurovum sp.]